MATRSVYDKWKEIKDIILSTPNVKVLGRSLFSIDGKCIYIYTRSDITVNTLNSILSDIKKYKNFTMPLYIVVDNDKKIDDSCKNYCNLFKNDLKLYKISKFNIQ
ncbi:hypothetical protein [Alkaliphilus sp. B6464]|uniref:hypothetical protein n=1 Tax=Alkaliphilus sp. B6464 TaxID=2731219 RepID=UPI001BA5853C|nr:hypothetical protein [Alkaliphilus sp. B6464]QUH22120.1 hypothetical protein HYG84_19630 [Alkaliphilus sp. B6464]